MTRSDDPGSEASHAPQEPSSNAPTIVGIGASAGALSALKKLFGAMPPKPGVTFVVVVHLSPEHESHLAELLQPHCKMPVSQVTETVALKANRVYVIPPDANLNTIDTHLRLSKLEARPRERATIDHFFRTLADTHDGNAVGVVLTGTGSDGTLGLRRIKEKGGLTIAQSRGEAEYDGMPRSAIAAGIVDLELPLAGMPDAILRFARTEPRVPLPAEGEEIDGDHNRILQKIFAQIRGRTGHDFSQYKRSTLMRRIRRRMQLLHVETLAAYLELIRERRQEAVDLFNDLLITVTDFFRDKEVFERLEQDVIPQLFGGRSSEDNLRVWSVGCSTGEEAYSLAMVLLEEATRRETHPRIQVFASDLHEGALTHAREGIYPEEIAAYVSAERLRRFFIKENGHYRVRREVREMVVFAPHDLLGDPPFSHIDLIVCRNVLIYLQRDVQQDVIRLFHYALEPDGLLLLGTSERIERADLFSCLDKDISLFRKKNVLTREGGLPVFPVAPSQVRRGFGEEEMSRPTESRLGYGAVHEMMVERYAPPSVLINEEHDIVHSSAHAGRYLRFPGGEPTRNLFKLVLPELHIELRAGLHTLRETGKPIRSKPISVTIGNEHHRIVLRILRANDPELAGHALLIFDEIEARADILESQDDAPSSATVRELEEELHINRQRLQSVIEEYESSREEMQASNEELQSANEELRSTMEELETSREELQSMNEELTTLNQENRHRVEELSQLSADLQNLLSATGIATIFLDRELRIVRFTPKVGELFNVRHTDRGRPLSDLTHHLGYDNLQADARQVLDQLVPIEKEIRSERGNWFLTRMLPYRTADDRIEGVVITLIDITKRKQAEAALRASEERYRTLFASIDEGFCVIEMIFDDQERPTDYRFLEVNPAFRKQTGITNPLGRRMREIAPDHEDHWFETYGRVALTGEAERFQKPAEALGRFYDVYAFPIGEPALRRVAVVFRDITERKRHEEHRRLVLAELNHRVKNTLAVVQSLARQTARSSTDLEHFSASFEQRLRSIAHAHGLLTKAEWQGANLGDILRSEIDPRLAAPDQCTISGPPVILKPQAALAMHMVIHELTTNAAKYGALRTERGRIEIAWSIPYGDGQALHLNWSEHCGQPVKEPARTGYGSNLIEDLIKYEFDGEVQREFHGEGVRYRIVVPLSQQTARLTEDQTARWRDAPATGHVLIVEDDFQLAKLLGHDLEEAGFTILGPARSLARAMELVAEQKPAAAVLDVNLRGEKVYPLADILRRQSVPFVLITGYEQSDLPEDLRDAPLLSKPVAMEELREFLRRHL